MYEGLLDPLLERYILPLSAALYAPATTSLPAIATVDNDRADSGSRAEPSRRAEEHTPGASTLAGGGGGRLRGEIEPAAFN